MNAADLDELRELREQLFKEDTTSPKAATAKAPGGDRQPYLDSEFQAMLKYMGAIVDKTTKSAPAKGAVTEKSVSKKSVMQS